MISTSSYIYSLFTFEKLYTVIKKYFVLQVLLKINCGLTFRWILDHEGQQQQQQRQPPLQESQPLLIDLGKRDLHGPIIPIITQTKIDQEDLQIVTLTIELKGQIIGLRIATLQSRTLKRRDRITDHCLLKSLMYTITPHQHLRPQLRRRPPPLIDQGTAGHPRSMRTSRISAILVTTPSVSSAGRSLSSRAGYVSY